MNRSVVFASPWCRLVAETLANGDPYYMLDVPDYVSIVACTPENRIVLVRQHRPVVGCEMVELPSGHVDAGETAEMAARRELLEETGMVARNLELLGTLVPDVGRLTNRMWCYFAADVVPVNANPVIEEGITPLDMSPSDAMAMAADGRLGDALNLAALFLAVSKRKLSLG